MSLWAIVPVKPLDQAKSRLASALGPDERVALVQRLLERTLDMLRQVPSVAEVLVVTGDPGVQAWCRGAGNRLFCEAGPPDLNRALRAATVSAQANGAKAVFIVHADLPQVTAAELEAMANLIDGGPLVAVAPDRHGRGTNALLCAPPGLIEYRFGDDSFALHCAQAQAAGARLEVCSAPGLALDIDLPEDLDLLRAQRPNFRPPDLGPTG
jgi:2-phospho-L-lactate/phosphoenolpyruvate guanylyltransferase